MAVLLANGGMKVATLDAEIDEDGGYEVVKPFDLADPVDMEDLYGLIEQGQDESQYLNIVFQH